MERERHQYGPEPIRLFRSDFLEAFTHIHPAVVPGVWGPVVTGFLAAAILRAARSGAGALAIPLGFLAGLFLWTLVEYTLHRYLFHFKPRTPRQERLSFLIHGVHHAQPLEKTRLVMPLPVSIPLALLFYALFRLVVGLLLGRPAWWQDTSPTTCCTTRPTTSSFAGRRWCFYAATTCAITPEAGTTVSA